MHILTHMQFGPVTSPRLSLRVRLLPGQFLNWHLLVVPGGLITIGSSYGRFMIVVLWVVRYMMFCCGSLGMRLVRANDIHICLRTVYDADMYLFIQILKSFLVVLFDISSFAIQTTQR